MNTARVKAILAVLGLSVAAGTARAEIIVEKDGTVLEGKVLTRDAKGLSIQVDGTNGQPPLVVAAANVDRVVEIDANGAETAEADGLAKPAKRAEPHWTVPAEPPGPPILPPSKDPTYYVVPLHGVVGETYVADLLDKALADATKRKPTVVILDINSPGGQVSEAEQMVKTLHQYNKTLRIVALADQDLSASAITSLSVRTIYMKSTGTFGAATAFDENPLIGPQDIQEKFQSAWRAVARNSAEEGGHEPLLAEAMIDNSIELHLETAGGKKVVKEGPGDEMLVKKGKILTLTSHEAVNCGLAAGVADDFAELGEALNLKGWKECPGLGTALAEYIPKRREAFDKKGEELSAIFRTNLSAAESVAPSEGRGTNQIFVTGAGTSGGPRIITQRIGGVSPEQQAQWKSRSLAAVVALQKAEQNIQDEISLATAFGQKGIAEEFKDVQASIGDARMRLYMDRNKYADGAQDNSPIVLGPGRGPGTGQPGSTAPPTPAMRSRGGMGMTGNPPPPLNLPYPPLPEAIAKTLRPMTVPRDLSGSLRNAVDESPDASILIGLRVGVAGNGDGEIITSLQAVLLTPSGVSIGPVRGQPLADKWVDLMAKPGYMVGQVLLSNVPYLEGLRLQFVPLSDGRKFVADREYSEIVGKFSKPGANVGAMPIVGIATATTGRQILELAVFRNDPPDPKPLSAMPQARAAQTPLAAPFVKLIKDNVANKTYEPGHISSDPSSVQKSDFDEVAPDGGLLIGFRYGWDNKNPRGIGSIQPIFLTAAGETLGQIHGDTSIALANVIKAPPGYAVGGMSRNSASPLPSFQLTYMKIGDRILSVDDAYLSERIGATPGASEASYKGDGTPVIGLCGISNGQSIVPGLTYLAASSAQVPIVKRPNNSSPDLATSRNPAVRPTPGRSQSPVLPNLNLNYAPLPIKLANTASLAVVKGSFSVGKMLIPPSSQNPADEDLAKDGGVLIGLRCRVGTFANKDVLTYAQPIFLTTQGVVVGPGRGGNTGTSVDLVAREGYAVGGATISARPYVDGLRLRFVRLADGRLNPADGYDSPTIGQVDDAQPAVGSMMPVLGIATRWTGAVMHLGLLTMTPDPKAPSALPSRPAAVPLTPTLAALAKDAAAHKTYAPGKYLGNGQKPDFEDFAPDGGLLVGLRYGRKVLPAGFPVVVSVQPIFWTAKGQVLGQVHGDPTVAPTDEIKAPAGYAVAGGIYGGGTFVEYMELTYMKIGDQMLLSGDACKGERVGALNAGNIDVSTTFSGDGTPVIGLGGTYQTNRLKLGLIYLAPTDAATPTSKTTAPRSATGAPTAP